MTPAAKERINSCKIKEGTARQIQSIHFMEMIKEARKTNTKIEIFSASISDINKALEIKIKQTPSEIAQSLPKEIRDKAKYFTEDEISE